MEDIELTKDQQDFMILALSGQNIFLTGRAGTGKSFVIQEFIKRTVKNVVKLGTTGIAAANIKGQTIHSFFVINPFQVYNGKNAQHLSQSKRKPIKECDVIIIDEVSMMRPDLLDAIDGTMKLNGCGKLSDKQIIFVGDLKQLPVVQSGREQHIINKTYGSHLFYNAFVYKKLDVKTVELNEIKRQSDERFITALNEIREGRKDEYFKQFVSEKPNDGVILAPHNSTVSQYNTKGLNKIKSPLITLKATIEGKIKPEDYKVDPIIHVKDGAKIMYCINNKGAGLVNGDIGTLKVEKDKMFFINKSGFETELERHTFENQKYVVENERVEDDEGNIHFKEVLKLKNIGEMNQYPIKLAYALSIHKSQGMTFDEVTIDLRRRCFVKGQMYVALSRVRTPKGLKIII